jgi:hypothetical protein
LVKDIPLENLEKIFSFYDKFHSKFLGDVKTLNCGDICSKCEANCEVCAKDDEIPYKYICVFLPYEVEYISSRMNIPLKEFKDKFVYGIKTEENIVNVLKFDRECPFLNDDFSCAMGENKIITCIIYPIIHYPLIEFSLSKHCDLIKDTKLKEMFLNGINDYKILLEELNFTGEYKYLRESFDILQIDAKKSSDLLKSKKYEIINIDEFKKFLLAEPELI